MDLHANQIQGFFDIPVDNLLGSPIFVHHFMEKYADCHEEVMVVSPDVGCPWPGPGPSLRSWICPWPSWTNAARRPTPPRS